MIFFLGGCALANRLTENAKWNVLLIEAGDVETSLQNIPVMAPYLVLSKYNWGYNTEPQTQGCLGEHLEILFLFFDKLIIHLSSRFVFFT